MEAARLNPDGSVAVLNVDAIPASAWQQIYQTMSGKGYDWPDANFARDATKRSLARGWGIESNPFTEDHAQAIAMALGLMKAAPRPKQKNVSPRNLQKAVQQFGLTDDFRLAGYILPDGSMLDFSGGSGARGYDHRDIGRAFGNGGTKGMYEFMNAGNVRVSNNSADCSRMPTEQQLRRIAEMAKIHQGAISLTLRNGANWDEAREISVGGKKWDNVYNIGTNPARILNDIRQFYSQKMAEALKWVRQNCRFIN